jgi:hypothetical protein
MKVLRSADAESGFIMSQLQNLKERPEGPEENRSDRKVGIERELTTNIEGTSQNSRICICAALSALALYATTTPSSRSGPFTFVDYF